MLKGKVVLVLALGCAVSLTGLTGCASKKKTAPPVVETQRPAPAPAPAPKPAPTPPAPEAPKPVPEPTPPRDLSFNTIYFDFDKSDVRSDQVSALNSNGDLLNRWKTISVRIEGNCDERGSNEYNLALGQRRADSAKRYLVDYGIPESRLTTISYGKERPVDSGHNEEAWAKNRRDDFVVTDR